MSRRRLFIWLSAAAGYTGIGLLLGYALSDQATNTPLWLGIILVLAGTVLLGMFISAGADRQSAAGLAKSATTAASSSGNITDLPPRTRPQ